MDDVKMGGHIPVLLKEVMDALAVRPGGRYVDGTLLEKSRDSRPCAADMVI